MNTFLKAADAGLALVATGIQQQSALKWSNNDIRHKVAQMVEGAAANVDLNKIFGSKSLFKPREYKPPAGASST